MCASGCTKFLTSFSGLEIRKLIVLVLLLYFESTNNLILVANFVKDCYSGKMKTEKDLVNPHPNHEQCLHKLRREVSLLFPIQQIQQNEIVLIEW